MRAQTQILFFRWVSLTKHSRVILRERRSFEPHEDTDQVTPDRD
jgi:hypothetical protein